MSCDSIVLIHAHLSTPDRIKCCIELINNVKKFGYEIILTTHTPASKMIQEKVDYFVYDKENIVLTDPAFLGYITYYTDNFDLSTQQFHGHNTTFAVFRLLYLGINYAKFLGKKIIHIMDYDGLIKSPHELQINEAKILSKKIDGVFYYWATENDHQSANKLQVTTRLMSGDVNYMYNCFSKYLSLEKQKDITLKYQFLPGEEFFAYVLNLTKFNDSKNTNVELVNFVPNLKKIQFEQDRMHIEETKPWVALCIGDLDKDYIFHLNHFIDMKMKVQVDDKIISDSFFMRGQYNLVEFNKGKFIEIFMNDELLKTFDLTDNDFYNNIKKTTTIYFKR